jgi:hypothetical protein
VPLESALVLPLQEMLDKGYLAVDAGGAFHIEGNAGKVVATLNRAFPAMKGITLSAYFEQTVNEVVSGRKPLDFALKQFDQNFIMHGVPLVRIQVPRTVQVREKKSKNIIKSPEPESGKPAPAAEPAPQQAAAAKDFDESQEAGRAGKVAEVTQAAATKAEERPVESPQQVEPVTADAAMASAQPQEEGEDVRTSMAEIISPQEMIGKEDVPTRETIAELAEEAAATDMEEVQEGQQGHACPDCGQPLLLKSDRFGRYWACSGYPACRHSESYETGQERKWICPVLSVDRSPLPSNGPPPAKSFMSAPATGVNSWLGPGRMP